MTKKTISISIKATLILLCATGIACLVMMPRILDYLLPGWSPATHRYWLYSIYLCAVPCFLTLAPAWLISGNIGHNNSFCVQNKTLMKAIGILMGIDTVIFLLTNTVLYIAGRSFTAFFIACFLINAIFFALTVCALALSSLLSNANELQEQSDYTI